MYKHVQPFWIFYIGIGFALVSALGVMLKMPAPEKWIVLIFMFAIIFLMLALFHSLTTVVDAEHLHILFGIGLIKRKIPLSEIRSAVKVRNKWWYGWGIRYVPSSGWMFNAHGLDALELEFKNGKKFRVGTVEPDALLAALRDKIG